MLGNIGNLFVKMWQVTKSHLYLVLGVLDYFVMYRHRARSLLWNVWKGHQLGNWSLQMILWNFCERFVVRWREFWCLPLVNQTECQGKSTSTPLTACPWNIYWISCIYWHTIIMRHSSLKGISPIEQYDLVSGLTGKVAVCIKRALSPTATIGTHFIDSITAPVA